MVDEVLTTGERLSVGVADDKAPPIQLGVGLLDGPGRREAAARHYASAAQRAAGVSRLVPHALLRLLQPEERLAVGEGDPHPLADRVRVFAGERENVGQEGFDAPVHRVSPPYRLSA